LHKKEDFFLKYVLNVVQKILLEGIDAGNAMGAK